MHTRGERRKGLVWMLGGADDDDNQGHASPLP